MHDYTELAKFYDDIAAKYLNYNRDFDSLLKLIKRSKVLEIGCGSGNMAVFLAKKGLDVTGVDDNVTMLAKAKAKSRNVNFIQQSFENLNLNQKFNTILFYESVLCIIRDGEKFFMETYLKSNEEIKEALAKLHKHLEKNGVVIISVKQKRDEEMRLNFKDDFFYHVKVDEYPNGHLKIHHFIDRGTKVISESIYDKFIMPLNEFENKYLAGNFEKFHLLPEKNFYLIQ